MHLAPHLVLFSIIFQTSDPPNINLSTSHVFGWEGQTRQVTCTSRALPLPTISWEKNGVNVNNDETVNIVTSREGRADTITSVLKVKLWTWSVRTILREVISFKFYTFQNHFQINISLFSSQNIYGVYSCIAKNKHGAVTGSFNLTKGSKLTKIHPGVNLS